MKQIANCVALAALAFLAWRVAALERRERYLFRALKLTARNVEKMADIEKFYYI